METPPPKDNPQNPAGIPPQRTPGSQMGTPSGQGHAPPPQEGTGPQAVPDNPQDVPNPQPEAQKKYIDDVLGTWALVLGILSFAGAFLPVFLSVLALFTALAALVMGGIALSKARKRNVKAPRAVWGMVAAVAGVVVFLLINLDHANKWFGSPTQREHRGNIHQEQSR